MTKTDDVAMFDVRKAETPAEPAKAETAPKKRPPGRPKGSKTRPDAPSKLRARKTADLEGKLRELISTGAGGLLVLGAMRGDDALTFDGKVVAHQAPAIARELKSLADRNPAVARALNALLGGAGVAPLVSVLVGTAVPIMIAHGVLPETVLAVVPNYPLAELGTPPKPKPRERRPDTPPPAAPPAAPSSSTPRRSAAPVATEAMTPQQREAAERLALFRNGGAK